MANPIQVRSPDLVKEANLLVFVDFAVSADDRIELKVNKKVKQISWTEKFWSNTHHFLSTGNGRDFRLLRMDERVKRSTGEFPLHNMNIWTVVIRIDVDLDQVDTLNLLVVGLNKTGKKE